MLQLQWNFDSDVYQPGALPLVSMWCQNQEPNPIFIPAFALEFDFGRYDLSANTQIAPGSTGFLGAHRLALPPQVAGTKLFQVRVRLMQFVAQQWMDQGEAAIDTAFQLNIFPLPRYRIFLSRSIAMEDEPLCAPFEQILREWGMEPFTVGWPQRVNDQEVLSALKQSVRGADAVVAIATPRYLDALTGLWRTLEWLHGETGVAFGMDKAMLIIRDTRVVLGALPGYLTQYGDSPLIEFDPYNVAEAASRLERMMPSFRQWVEQRRRLEFDESRRQLWKGIAIGALATIVIGGGIAGIAAAKRSNDRRIPDKIDQHREEPAKPKIGPYNATSSGSTQV